MAESQNALMGFVCLWGWGGGYGSFLFVWIFLFIKKPNLTEATFCMLTLALNNLSVFSGQDNDNVHCW